MTMDNEWKNSLRERFSDYAAPEPEGLWEGIEQGIAGKPRRKMLPVWLGTGLAAAAAVALVVFLHPDKTTEPLLLQDQARYAESVPADTAATSFPAPTSPSFPAPTGNLEAETVAEPAQAPASKSVPFAVVSRQTLLSEAEPAPSVPVDEDLVPDAVSDPHSGLDLSRHSGLDPESVPEQEPLTEKEEVEEMPDQVGHDVGINHDLEVGHDGQVLSESKKTGQTVAEALQDMIPSGEITREPTRKRFSISAYGHGGQASSEQLQGYGMNQTGIYLNTRAIGSNMKNDVGGMMRTLASNKASTFEAHHAGPVRMGVTAAWELAPHLSLVSGLNWTTLHSEFDESVEPFHTVTDQDLGFLGVPLRLGTDWNIWKGLYVHASAGGMVEKGLLSSSWTNTWVEGQDSELTKNPRPDTGGLFWSVGASAGAEYRFNDFIGIYLTPGIEFHFANDAPVRCAYTEKPLHWNAELGVRFHFGGD